MSVQQGCSLMVYAIICIDDDPIILNMLDFQLRKLINNEKIVFEYYSDPILALEEIQQMPQHDVTPIIVITDYQMPEMNGAKLVRELKSAFINLKCIMLSGQANAIQVDDLVNEELLTSFILKPWSENDLFGVLQNILEEKNLMLRK